MSPQPSHSPAAPAAEIDSPTYFFTARELARMSVYRAAVLARFYTDDCTELELAGLPASETAHAEARGQHERRD